jgi:hypothetical protein
MPTAPCYRLGLECTPKTHALEVLFPRVVLLGDSGTFKWWSLMRGRLVIGGLSLKGTVEPLLFLSLLPGHHKVSSSLYHMLPAMIYLLPHPQVQMQQAQATIQWSLWNHEPEWTFSLYKLSHIICYSNRKLTNTYTKTLTHSISRHCSMSPGM